MHPNPIFRAASRERNLGFARDRAFGVLAVNDRDGPLMSHVPFLLAEDGITADLHLVRSNPIVGRLAAPQLARLAVIGADGYISPDWYEVEDQVPTWNYVAVHLQGELERLPQDRLRAMLERQSAFFEDRLAPKPAWHPGKMSDGVMERMMRMIVPCRLTIGKVDGTWKLGQNKDDDVRRAAARGAEAAGLADLARLMDQPPGR